VIKQRLLWPGKTSARLIATARINKVGTLPVEATGATIISIQHVAEIVAVGCVLAQMLTFAPIWNQLHGVANKIVPIFSITALQVWPKVSIARGAFWAGIFTFICIQV